jgi:four helix bundle protein
MVRKHHGSLKPKERSRKERPAQDLEERITRFCVDVIKLVASFPHATAPDVLGKELLRSATLIAPAYREANRSVDRAEFSTKIATALKEAMETQYWLELLIKSEVLGASAAVELHRELGNLLDILGALTKRLEKR